APGRLSRCSTPTPRRCSPAPSSSPFSSTAPPPTPISTLSLHDALPISTPHNSLPTGTTRLGARRSISTVQTAAWCATSLSTMRRSEEHTSELQSRGHLVCRLLLEKKKNQFQPIPSDQWSTGRDRGPRRL